MSGYRFHDEAEAAQLAAIAEAEGTRRREPNGHGAAAASNFPTILVKAGERYLAADAGLKALHAAGTPFYQRDRALVRVCEVKARSTSGEVILVPGIATVTPAILDRALGQAAAWQRFDPKTKNLVRTDPPAASRQPDPRHGRRLALSAAGGSDWLPHAASGRQPARQRRI
jgi:hypothetical protein